MRNFQFVFFRVEKRIYNQMIINLENILAGKEDLKEIFEEYISYSHMLNFFNFIEEPENIKTGYVFGSSFADYFIEEKMKYLQRLKANIEDYRDMFKTNCNEIEKSIKKTTNEAISQIRLKEQVLLNRLDTISDSALSEWTRQSKLCDKGMRWLQSIDLDLFNAIGLENLEKTCNKKFIENLGEIRMIHYEIEPTNIMFDDLDILLKTKEFIRAPKFIIGKGGENPGEFCRPWGVCTDGLGRILVADRSNHRIQIFSESGEFLLQFGKRGAEQGEFSCPSGIAADNKSRIVVADKDNHRIQIFTSSGVFLFKFGAMGSAPREFNYPWDVAVNSKCDIAVSDSKNHRVQLFDERGVLLSIFGFGLTQHALSRLDSPRGLIFTPDDELLLTDFNNHRILVLNADFELIKKFGHQGHEAMEFIRPQGITCNEEGLFAVADCKNHRIQVFDSQGRVLKVFGTHGKNPGQFDCPQGICYHPNGNLIVVDFSNNRLQVF